jgi:WD40 repeat protein
LKSDASEDIVKWLKSIGLAQYASAFGENEMSWSDVLALDHAQLKEDLGVKALGHRNRLLEAASQLKLGTLEKTPPAIVQALAAAFGRKPRVFLSYGHDESCGELVERIKTDLIAHGYDPWVDTHEIKFNDDWRAEITRGLIDSGHVLAFMSTHSTRKPGVCRQEVAIALGPGKCHVYTVLVEALHLVTPPLLISRRQWLDMHDWRGLREKDPKAYEAQYRSGLAEILRVLERNEPFAGEVRDLERWLKPMDCTSDMVAAEDGFIGRQWLLGGLVDHRVREDEDEEGDNKRDEQQGEIERWRTDGTPRKVFWLSAGPGWGKSAVAARLAHAGRARVMAVHFCKSDEPSRRDARRVMRSIAFQMATQFGEYRTLLLQELRKGTMLDEFNAKELFQLLLANPLSAFGIEGGRGPHDRHLIVLDAIDETLDGDGRSDLLTLVADEFGKLPAWLGLVITSRPEAPVMRQFGQFGVNALTAEDPRNLHDVCEYATQWLRALSLDDAQRAQALAAVMQAGAGNFLYLRQLESAVRSGLVGAGELAGRAPLPKGLTGIYERWFMGRFPSQDEYTRLQRPLLEMMLAARESLPIELARHLLGWAEYGYLDVVEPLGSLCTVQAERITFFHKSLRDWLARPDSAGRYWYASEANGHRRIASIGQSWITERNKGFSAFGSHAELYVLKHLFEHMRLAELAPDREAMLTDFGLAMRRCEAGAFENLVQDYEREANRTNNDVLRAWGDCIGRNSHLLRRGQPEWPVQNILMQVALEHAQNSPITKAAEEFLQTRAVSGAEIVMRRMDRPDSPVLERSAKLGVIELVVDSWGWKNNFVVINPLHVVVWDSVGICLVDVSRAVVVKRREFECCDVVALNENMFAVWGSDHVTVLDVGLQEVISPIDMKFLFIEKFGERLLVMCTSETLLIFDVQSRVVLQKIVLDESIDGAAFDGENILFFWQGGASAPCLFDVRKGEMSRLVSDFESANLDGAFFVNLNTIVFWSDTDVCIHLLRSGENRYIEFLPEDSDLEEFMGVRAHSHESEVLVWSTRRILRYDLDGCLLGTVKPPFEFYNFTVRKNGSFIVWSLDFSVWESQEDSPPVILRETNDYDLWDWHPDGRLVVDANAQAVRVLDSPIYSVTRMRIAGNKLIVLEDSGTLSFWDLDALILKQDAPSVPDQIGWPWRSRTGRVTYIDPEGDLCIFAKDCVKPEFVLYGFSSQPDDLIIGKEQIALISKQSVYLYDFSGNLLRRFKLGKFLGAFPAVKGKLVTWDSKSIRVWDCKGGDPIALRGIDDHLDDDPISGASVSACGTVVVAWSKFGEVYSWRIGDHEHPDIVGVYSDVRMAVSFLDQAVLYVAVQTVDGTVLVVVANQGGILASRCFSGDVIRNLEVNGRDLVIEFDSLCKWDTKSDAVLSPPAGRSIEVGSQRIRYSEKGQSVEWHCDYDISWAVPLGEDEVFVASDFGEILRIARQES